MRGADSDNLHVCAPLPNSVLCIGLGVGCAAIVGTLRFIRDWCALPHRVLRAPVQQAAAHRGDLACAAVCGQPR